MFTMSAWESFDNPEWLAMVAQRCGVDPPVRYLYLILARQQMPEQNFGLHLVASNHIPMGVGNPPA